MEFKRTLRILLCLILLAYTTLLFVVMLDTYDEDYEGKITNIRSRRGTVPFSAKFSTVITSFKNVLHSPLIPPPHARKLHAYHDDGESDNYNDDVIELHQKMSENYTDIKGKDYKDDGIKSPKKRNENDNLNQGRIRQHALDQSGREKEIHTGYKVNDNADPLETDYVEDYDNLVGSLEDLDYNWHENQYEYRNFVKHRLFTDLFTPEYIIENAKLCGDNPYIFAFINSRVDSHEIRRVIRRSYVQEFSTTGISYAFIISKPQTEGDMQLLKEENDLYGDLVVTGDEEAYENLTLKTAHLLHWAKKNCLHTTYVAKVDDDVFVNVNKLMDVLAVPRNFTILGKICSSCQPNRGDGSLTLKKSMAVFSNVVTTRHMPLLKLPPFAMGPAYIITLDAAEWMLEAAQYLFYFSYEDVFWTGLVVEVVNKESGITFDVEKDEREELAKNERIEPKVEEEDNTRYKYKANRDKDGDDMVRRIRMDSIKKDQSITEKEKEGEEDDIESSIKYKYLTMKAEITPKVTINRENIRNFRSDRRPNEPLSEAVIAKHSSSIIIHGIQWMKDEAFMNELREWPRKRTNE